MALYSVCTGSLRWDRHTYLAVLCYRYTWSQYRQCLQTCYITICCLNSTYKVTMLYIILCVPLDVPPWPPFQWKGVVVPTNLCMCEHEQFVVQGALSRPWVSAAGSGSAWFIGMYVLYVLYIACLHGLWKLWKMGLYAIIVPYHLWCMCVHPCNSSRFDGYNTVMGSLVL